MRNIFLFLFILSIFLLTGCATTSVLILDESKHYPPTQYVEILNSSPSEPYVVIAQLETRGAVVTSLPQILESMRDESKSIGAESIIHTEDVSEQQKKGLSYNPWLGGHQTLPGGKVHVMRGLEIIYANRSTSINQNMYKPKRAFDIGIETFGLPYFSGGYGGTLWFGKNHFRIRGGIANLKTPSVYLRDGFENDSWKMTVFSIEYFLKKNYNGLWFGSGIGSWNGTVGHENEIELGSYEYVSWGVNMGYSYKLVNNFYINAWGGLNMHIIGDTETQVGSRTIYFDEGAPLISLDIGWYY